MDVTQVDVRRVLSKLLLENSAANYDSKAMLDALAIIAQPHLLAGLIDSVYTDSRAVASCASRSFRHPLGFDKIMLLNCLPLFSLRIHVWPPSENFGAEHIHNHRFNFLSFAVRGGYTMETFQAGSNGGAVMTEYQEALTQDGSWELRPLGDAYIQPLNTIVIKQGSGYELRADTLHKVIVPPRAMCMTVFLQTTPTRTTTRVFTGPKESAPIRSRKETLSAAAYRCKLETIASELVSDTEEYASTARSIALRLCLSKCS
jgi:hypothetical protein